MSIMSSPQRGIAPATIAYKAIVLTTTTMGATPLLGNAPSYLELTVRPIRLLGRGE
jgi:hypothetical protein